jgi:hypothetical protein
MRIGTEPLLSEPSPGAVFIRIRGDSKDRPYVVKIIAVFIGMKNK